MRLRLFLLTLLFNVNWSNAISQFKEPNILFFLVDDLGWYDLGFQGSKFYETPVIDSLSKRGMIFSSAYSSHPRFIFSDSWIKSCKSIILAPSNLVSYSIVHFCFNFSHNLKSWLNVCYTNIIKVDFWLIYLLSGYEYILSHV